MSMCISLIPSESLSSLGFNLVTIRFVLGLEAKVFVCFSEEHFTSFHAIVRKKSAHQRDQPLLSTYLILIQSR